MKEEENKDFSATPNEKWKQVAGRKDRPSLLIPSPSGVMFHGYRTKVLRFGVDYVYEAELTLFLKNVLNITNFTSSSTSSISGNNNFRPPSLVVLKSKSNVFQRQRCSSSNNLALLNHTHCRPCPPLGTCNGTAIMVTNYAAWRPSPFFPSYLECGRTGCSLPGIPRQGWECQEGYSGELCAECVRPAYVRNNEFCVPCHSRGVGLLVLAVFLALVVAYVTLFVFLEMRVENLTPTNRAVFEMFFDKDKSNDIDRNELHQCMEQLLDRQISAQELDLAVLELDADGDEKISQEEFCNWFSVIESDDVTAGAKKSPPALLALKKRLREETKNLNFEKKKKTKEEQGTESKKKKAWYQLGKGKAPQDASGGGDIGGGSPVTLRNNEPQEEACKKEGMESPFSSPSSYTPTSPEDVNKENDQEQLEEKNKDNNSSFGRFTRSFSKKLKSIQEAADSLTTKGKQQAARWASEILILLKMFTNHFVIIGFVLESKIASMMQSETQDVVQSSSVIISPSQLQAVQAQLLCITEFDAIGELYAAFPLIVFIVVCTFGGIGSLYFIKSLGIKSPRKKFTAIILIALVLSSAPIMNVCAGLWSCEVLSLEDANGKVQVFDSLYIDRSVKCHGSRFHVARVYSIFLGLLCIVGIPVLAILLYLRHRRLYGEKKARRHFGFLTSNFVPESWFWELILMMRKYSCVFVTLAFKTNALLHLSALRMICLLSLFLHWWRHPYSNDDYNLIDTISLLNAMLLVDGMVIWISLEGRPEAFRTTITVLVLAAAILGLVPIPYIFWKRTMKKIKEEKEVEKKRLAALSSSAIDEQPIILGEKQFSGGNSQQYAIEMKETNTAAAITDDDHRKASLSDKKIILPKESAPLDELQESLLCAKSHDEDPEGRESGKLVLNLGSPTRSMKREGECATSNEKQEEGEKKDNVNEQEGVVGFLEDELEVIDDPEI